MTHVHSRFLIVAVALSLAGGISARAAARTAPPAQEKTTPEKTPTVAGKWQIDTETPHGRLVLGIDLKVDAKDSKKVTGTLSSDQMGDMPLTGEFVDGKLTFVIKSDEGDLTFAAKFKDADTLAGILSSHMGDLTCNATRVKKSGQR
jgi:hypothetical protein